MHLQTPISKLFLFFHPRCCFFFGPSSSAGPRKWQFAPRSFELIYQLRRNKHRQLSLPHSITCPPRSLRSPLLAIKTSSLQGHKFILLKFTTSLSNGSRWNIVRTTSHIPLFHYWDNLLIPFSPGFNLSPQSLNLCITVLTRSRAVLIYLVTRWNCFFRITGEWHPSCKTFSRTNNGWRHWNHRGSVVPRNKMNQACRCHLIVRMHNMCESRSDCLPVKRRVTLQLL